MPKIVLSGCNGRMGRVITEICAAKPDMQIVAGFDLNTQALADYPVFAHRQIIPARATWSSTFPTPR